VGDDDHRRITIVQHIFQPANGIDVEVVGRFVEQQDVRVGEQRLAEQHAQLPAGSDFAHRAVVLFGGDTNAQQQLASAGFGGVAIVFTDLAFELGGAHVVVFAGFGIGVDRVAFLDRVPQFFVAHHHHVEHAHVFVGKLILLEVGHAFMNVFGDVTG